MLSPDENEAGESGNIAIHRAINSDSIENLKLLVENGVDVNAKNGEGDLPLKLCLYRKNKLKLITYLLDNGADINGVDRNGNTVTYHAVKLGLNDVVNLLIDRNANLNLTGRFKDTPLSLAVTLDNAKNNTRIIQKMINQGANINYVNHLGFTPLLTAIWSGTFIVARLLIDNDADLSIKCQSRLTDNIKYDAFYLALDGTIWHFDYKVYLSTSLHFTLIKLILEKIGDLLYRDYDIGGLSQRDWLKIIEEDIQSVKRIVHFKKLLPFRGNNTLLHDAIKNKFIVMAKFYIEIDGDLATENSEGYTPLQYLIVNGKNYTEKVRIFLIESMIKNDSDINNINSKGFSALQLAMMNEHFDIVEKLIEHHSNVVGIDHRNGNNLAHFTVSCFPERHNSAIEKHLNKVLNILFLNGVDINEVNKHKQSVLDISTEMGMLIVVKSLIEKGAKLKIDKNETILHLAIRSGNAQLFEYLLDLDGLLNNLNDVDCNGETLLYHASKKGNIAIVKLLVNRGADIEIPNNEGYTALQIATIRYHFGIVKLLIEIGANYRITTLDGNNLIHLILAKGWGHSYFQHEIFGILHTVYLEMNSQMNAIYNEFKNGGKIIIASSADHKPIFTISNSDYDFRFSNLRIMDETKIIKFLLGKGLNVNALNNEGETALLIAAKKHLICNAYLIMKSGAFLNVQNNFGDNLLHLAFFHSFGRDCEKFKHFLMELVSGQLFVSVEINEGNVTNDIPFNCTKHLFHVDNLDIFNAADYDGNTLLHKAFPKLLPMASFEKLLKYTDPNTMTFKNFKNQTPLHTLMYQIIEHSERYHNNLRVSRNTSIHLLEDSDRYHNSYNTPAVPSQCTPICETNKNNETMIKLFLTHNVDINAIDDEGNAAIHIALRKKKFCVAYVLFENGADLVGQDRQGFNPINLLIESANSKCSNVTRLLHLMLGSEERIKREVINSTADDGDNAVHRSIRKKLYSITSLILESGDYEINKRNRDGDTALHLIAKYCEVTNNNVFDIVRHLITSLIDLGANPNLTNNNGKSPREIAFEKGFRLLS